MTAFAWWAGTSVWYAVLAGLALAGAWLALRVAGVRRGTTLPDLLIAVTVATILILTLRAGSVFRPVGAWQLQPFGDLLIALRLGPRDVALALLDLVGNVVLFAPFGGALALRWPSLRAGHATAIALLLSLAVETIQSLASIGRTAQVTDLLMNALGGWLGWLAVDSLRRVAWISAGVQRRR